MPLGLFVVLLVAFLMLLVLFVMLLLVLPQVHVCCLAIFFIAC